VAALAQPLNRDEANVSHASINSNSQTSPFALVNIKKHQQQQPLNGNSDRRNIGARSDNYFSETNKNHSNTAKNDDLFTLLTTQAKNHLSES